MSGTVNLRRALGYCESEGADWEMIFELVLGFFGCLGFALALSLAW